MMEHRLIVYARISCHLCTEMVRALSELQRELGFEFHIREIDGRADLERLYGSRVPVLMAGEVEICHYFLDEDRLRRYILGS
jgi:hypothetical protein